MKLVSNLLVVSVVGAAVFAMTPHRSAARPHVAPPTPIAILAFATPEPSAPATPASAASGPAVPTVDTKDFAYAPDSLTVAVGQTVLFKNSDTVAHTVTAADGSFDSGEMATGATWSHTFAKPGTYAYYCAYHRYMRGSIVVK